MLYDRWQLYPLYNQPPFLSLLRCSPIFREQWTQVWANHCNSLIWLTGKGTPGTSHLQWPHTVVDRPGVSWSVMTLHACDRLSKLAPVHCDFNGLNITVVFHSGAWRIVDVTYLPLLYLLWVSSWSFFYEPQQWHLHFFSSKLTAKCWGCLVTDLQLLYLHSQHQ